MVGRDPLYSYLGVHSIAARLITCPCVNYTVARSGLEHDRHILSSMLSAAFARSGNLPTALIGLREADLGDITNNVIANGASLSGQQSWDSASLADSGPTSAAFPMSERFAGALTQEEPQTEMASHQ